MSVGFHDLRVSLSTDIFIHHRLTIQLSSRLPNTSRASPNGLHSPASFVAVGCSSPIVSFRFLSLAFGFNLSLVLVVSRENRYSLDILLSGG
ncbi:hypothetical protein SLA2020_372850 [Shorea laevis]